MKETRNFSKFQANILQIIRSQQKDELYISGINEELQEIIKQLTGIRYWIKWQKTINHFNTFIYYLLTTAAGKQSLGEEYCHIIQIFDKTIPTFFRRFLLSLGYAFSFKLVKFFEKLIIKFGVIHGDEDNINQHIKCILELIARINRSIFFLNGIYPDIFKRLFSIQYLSTTINRSLFTLTYNNSDNNDNSTINLMASLSIMQLVLSFYYQYKIMIVQQQRHNLKKSAKKIECLTTNLNTQTTNIEYDIDSFKRKCILCTFEFNIPTLLLCGHVFCWNCINDWLTLKDECPVCKSNIDKRQCTFLRNFS